MIKIILLLVFALGGTWIVLLQADIIKGSYQRKKRHRHLSQKTKPLSLEVIARADMTDQHFSVRLKAVNNTSLKGFQAGQYLTLVAQTQADQNSRHKRRYSLASWQEKSDFYELGIQRESHGQVSNWLHQNLKPGTIIDALPPKGEFVFNPGESEHVVLVAGGIGITPLRAMIHQFVAQKRGNISTVKTMHLFYSAKSIDKMCYWDEFTKLADEHADFHFYPTLSQAEEGWQGLSGRINAKQLTQNFNSKLKLNDKDDKNSSVYYMCGPSEMMLNIQLGLIEHGVHSDNIHFERFGLGDTNTDEEGEAFLIDLGADKPVIFQSQGSLLDALEQEGLKMESECRSGECGQCKVTLRSGRVKQLVEPEVGLRDGEILPCCCVPESDICIGV